jgi:hypothetical protein
MARITLPLPFVIEEYDRVETGTQELLNAMFGALRCLLWACS